MDGSNSPLIENFDRKLVGIPRMKSAEQVRLGYLCWLVLKYM